VNLATLTTVLRSLRHLVEAVHRFRADLRLLLPVLLIGLTGGAALAALSNERPDTRRLSMVSRSIYWGAYINGDDTYRHLYGGTWGNAPWNAPAWSRFESNAGKPVSIIHWGVGTPWAHSFDYWRGTLDLVRRRGDINLIDLQSGRAWLRDIAKGAYDTSFVRWAQQARAYGRPFFLRWDWEMNGNWFPWGTTRRSRNSPADYVAAWRHIHDIFTRVGAANVTWVWCPNVDPRRKFVRYKRLYPGDAYVDWTGLDGYNQTGGQSFKWLFGRSYEELLRIAPSKPIIIAETSSVEGGRLPKPAWVRDALTNQLPRNFPQVKAVAWMNWRIHDGGKLKNWQIESSPSSRAAFVHAIASPYYASGGGFANLPLLTKIAPLP
jgi:mannan endo-1,4-beta-mannosidase